MTNLEKFRLFCEDLPSPQHFIDFNHYFQVSSCLARKVWIGSEGGFQVFPNLYIIFVGDPGVGKSLPVIATNRILSTNFDRYDEKTKRVRPLVNLGPSTITFEKLLIRAADIEFTEMEQINGHRKIYAHSSSCFILNELGTLLRDHTNDIVTFLVDAWDCGKYENDTISRGACVIRKICVNFMACTTQEKVGRLMDKGLLEDGFTARTLFLYSERSRKSPAIIETTEEKNKLIPEIQQHLKQLCMLMPGEVQFSDESRKWFNEWWEVEQTADKINPHRRLKDYYSRKKVHLLKIAMAVHFSEQLSMILEVEDFTKAVDILNHIEPQMHQALSSGGRNPLQNLAEEIKKELLIRRQMSIKAIELSHFSGGDLDSIKRVIDYLVKTEQVSRIVMGEKQRPGIELIEKGPSFEI